MSNINGGVLDGIRRIGAKVRELAIDGGLPGAPLGFRLRGATQSGYPLTGTWKAGDLVPDRNGAIWICTAGGTGPAAVWAGGTVVIDVTATDIKLSGTQAAGSTGRAADAGHVHPSCYASQTLASPAANITFSAIPAGYGVLRLLVTGASAAAAETDRWLTTVNGDAGSHYDEQAVAGSNATTTSTVGTALTNWRNSATVGDLPGASATAGVAGILDVVIPNYAGTTFQKIGTFRSGYSDGATAAADQTNVSQTIAWRSTAAITSVTVATVSGSNLVTGTAAYLYVN